MTMSGRWGSCACARLVALAAGLALAGASACQPAACQELVLRTCGAEATCDDSVPCRSAKGLQRDGVDAACEAALANALSYPACDEEEAAP